MPATPPAAIFAAATSRFSPMTAPAFIFDYADADAAIAAAFAMLRFRHLLMPLRRHAMPCRHLFHAAAEACRAMHMPLIFSPLIAAAADIFAITSSLLLSLFRYAIDTCRAPYCRCMLFSPDAPAAAILISRRLRHAIDARLITPPSSFRRAATGLFAASIDAMPPHYTPFSHASPLMPPASGSYTPLILLRLA